VSLQAKIVKRLLRLLFQGWSRGSIEEQRARHERSTRWNRLPADVHCKPVSADGIAAEWIESPGADCGVILYLHGGAYALGSIHTCRELVARLARATRMRGLAINYRLAPEHPFPAALEDATKAYAWLLAKEVEPSRIIVAGDSAGGGLALAALVALRDAGKPLPAGAVCISPWTDLTLSGASIQSRAHVDCMLDADSLEMYAKLYAGERDRTSPLISPLFADLSDLPPLLIQVGTDEILLDDAMRCADRARQAGVDVTLEIWDGMFHVFQLVPFLPETTKAVGHMAEFVSQNLNRSEWI
jgi:monoterpene epsilon-lactone hydrolase